MISEAARILNEPWGIEIDVTKPLKEFSTAVQQMVAIARAVSIQRQNWLSWMTYFFPGQK